MGGMALGCSASARKGGNPNNRRCYRGFRLALGPVIDTPILQQDPRARKAEGDNVCSDKPTQEELLQSRMQLEEELGVAAEYEDIVKAKVNVAGSRNFTVEEPSIRMLWCPPGSFDMGPGTESGRNTTGIAQGTFSQALAGNVSDNPEEVFVEPDAGLARSSCDIRACAVPLNRFDGCPSALVQGMTLLK